MSGESRLEDALGLYGEGARAEPRRSPFKFLDAYERDDRDIFFGRDAEIEDVRSRYYRSRVVTVYGESGAGKTSLVQCGLANAVPAEDADFIAVRSNVDPLQSARTQLGAAGGGDAGLADLVAARAAERSRTVVLVFDQLEELFLFQPAPARERLLAELAAALARKLDLKVIFCVREEYFARMTEVEKAIPEVFASRFWLRRMDAREARRAIEEPCRRLGIDFDQGLAEAILGRLRDARDEIDLPYLQIVLDRLHRRAEERGAPLTLLGSDLEALGAMQDILFGFLEERVAELPSPELGREVLKAFVTAARTRRPAGAAQVAREVAGRFPEQSEESVRALLLDFVQVRVLRQESAEAPFELRHDTLAEAISRWLTPMEEERLRIRSLVDGRHAEHRSTGHLIEDAALLAKIEPYLPHLCLPPEEREFLRRSRAAVEATRRRRKRLRAAAAIALLCAAGSGVAVYVSSSRAHERELRAERDLARQGKEQAERERERAERERERAERERERAEREREHAERERKRAEQGEEQAEESLRRAHQAEQQLQAYLGATSGGVVANASAVVASLRAGFRHCYDQGLKSNPEMQGTMTVRANVGMNGMVTAVSGDGSEALGPIVPCIKAVVERARFAPPEGGEATISIPISFVRGK